MRRVTPVVALLLASASAAAGERHEDRADAREARRHDAPGKAFDREERQDRPRCEKAGAGCVCPVGAEGPGSLPHEFPCFPAFGGDVQPLTAALRDTMRGRSWHEGCLPFDALAVVTVTTWDLHGDRTRGRLVVAAAAAAGLRETFRRLYEARFPLERLEPVDAFDGDDDASMAANNSSGFNCRTVPGTSRPSRHAVGEAVDLNPVQNPFVRPSGVWPPAGKPYLDRRVQPGLIVAEGPAVRAFEAIGWKWGGRWKRSKDFQHFSRTGD